MLPCLAEHSHLERGCGQNELQFDVYTLSITHLIYNSGSVYGNASAFFSHVQQIGMAIRTLENKIPMHVVANSA